MTFDNELNRGGAFEAESVRYLKDVGVLWASSFVQWLAMRITADNSQLEGRFGQPDGYMGNGLCSSPLLMFKDNSSGFLRVAWPH